MMKQRYLINNNVFYSFIIFNEFLNGLYIKNLIISYWMFDSIIKKFITTINLMLGIIECYKLKI
jgi:hypothetical protein